MQRDTRHYARIRVPEKYRVACEGLDRPLAGEILVMGLGGLLIRTPEKYPAGTVISLRVTYEGESIEALCAVRNHDAESMGVEFVQLRGKHEENLKRIMDLLAG